MNNNSTSTPNSASTQQIIALLKKILSNTDQTSVDEALVQAQDTTKTTPKSKIGKIVSTGLNVLDKASPLLSLLPGGSVATGIIKNLATTLNDDEWFGEFKSAGVTANEYLQLDERGEDEFDVTAAFAIVDTAVPHLYGEQGKTIMPSIIAYIRDKTNNVLVEDMDQYRWAIRSALNLYALYYTGRKYIELALHQPPNIPVITDALSVISPLNLSQFKGMIDGLGDYLKTTIRLPYAVTAYVRWRYGTTFYSDNTGKPGLILYDLLYAERDIAPTWNRVDGTSTLAQWSDAIDFFKVKYISTGRAGADVRLAFVDHAVSYDVEPAHYDAKEYNLRANMSSVDKFPSEENRASVYIDSRLDQNAAIQAVTLSTISGLTPFQVKPPRCFIYVPKPITKVGIAVVQQSLTPLWKRLPYTITAGWHFIDAGNNWMNDKYAFGKNSSFVVRWSLPDGPGVTPSGDMGFIASPELTEEVDDNINVTYGGHSYSGTFINDKFTFDSVPASAPSDDWFTGKMVSNYLTMMLGSVVANALQIHNLGYYTRDYESYFSSTSLSYDRAYVTTENIEAIQRTALRNLFRGNYKAKQPINQNPELKAAVSDVQKAAVESLT